MAPSEIQVPPFDTLFNELEAYSWLSDSEFQDGLRVILGANTEPEQAEKLTLQAKCFYFSRKINVPIPIDEYLIWRSQFIPVNGSLPASFATICNENATITPNCSISSQQNTYSSPSAAAAATIASASSATLPTSTARAVTSESALAAMEPPLSNSTSSTVTAPSATPYPQTFSQIVDLISTGQPIPGIKDIPDTTLPGQDSQTIAPKRRKPWEKSDEENERVSHVEDPQSISS